MQMQLNAARWTVVEGSCTPLKLMVCVPSAGLRLHKHAKGKDTEVEIRYIYHYVDHHHLIDNC